MYYLIIKKNQKSKIIKKYIKKIKKTYQKNQKKSKNELENWKMGKIIIFGKNVVLGEFFAFQDNNLPGNIKLPNGNDSPF